jgi:hypothetical protein
MWPWYRTDRRLWAAFAVGIFVALGLLAPVADGSSAWAQARTLSAWEYAELDREAVGVVARALLLGAVSALAGWAAQRLAAGGWAWLADRLSRPPSGGQAADYDDARAAEPIRPPDAGRDPC